LLWFELPGALASQGVKKGVFVIVFGFIPATEANAALKPNDDRAFHDRKDQLIAKRRTAL
jgi:hypothetical protein